MRMNEWTWAYQNHQIRLTMSGDSARLYVDGELLDLTNDIHASGDEPTLVGVFCELRVEAFAGVVQPSLRINEEWVGNETYATASD